MKTTLWLLIFILSTCSVGAQITKIEHFNAHHAEAKTLFNLFKSTFNLPEIYPYQNFGPFSSGGLWLGNVTMEFVCPAANPPQKAIFKGVSLEPAQHTDSILPELNKRQIASYPPDPVKTTENGVEKTLWIITGFKDLSAPEQRVFMCDYQDRNWLNGLKKTADDSLKNLQGGPLGIIGMKTIVFGVTNPEKSAATWSLLPGIFASEGNRFSFKKGPNLVLRKSEKDGILEIIVQVKSLKNASFFLAQNQLLKLENGQVLIHPDKLYGLRIVLEE
jgi:hypothetical protein